VLMVQLTTSVRPSVRRATEHPRRRTARLQEVRLSKLVRGGWNPPTWALSFHRVGPHHSRRWERRGKNEAARASWWTPIRGSRHGPAGPYARRSLKLASGANMADRSVQERTSAGASSQHRELGFAGLNDHRLRSVLHHPLGLPLTWFLNKIALSAGSKITPLEQDSALEAEGVTPPSIETMFPEAIAKLEAASEAPEWMPLDSALAKSYEAWKDSFLAWRDQGSTDAKPGETKLTELLTSAMQAVLKESKLDVLHQKALQSNEVSEVSAGISDVILCSEAVESTEDRPTAQDACLVLEVEVGLSVGCRAWWTKLHQSRQYEAVLTCGPNKVRVTSKAMLLAALTIDRRKDDYSFNSGRLGVFLVTNRRKAKSDDTSHESRVCLLTRIQSDDLNDLSAAFGLVLRAAICLPDLTAESVDFEYLGPNCCRIDNQVRRPVPRYNRATVTSYA
jgi:hypothetical protein